MVISTVAMALDSASVFDAAITDLGLTALKPKFVSEGWATFADFAYCTPDISGRDTSAFEKVVDDLLEEDGSQKNLRVKLHRLYAHASQAASQSMMEALEAKDPGAKASMHHADRVANTASVRTKLTAFKLSGPNMPSSSLQDKFHTILTKGAVKYVAWENAHRTKRKSGMNLRSEDCASRPRAHWSRTLKRTA